MRRHVSEPGGLGCEPASAASVAGAKRLRDEGVIAPSDRVVCILTGHQLKDPTATVAYHSTDQAQFDQVLGSRGVQRAGFANRPVVVANDLDDIIRTIALYSGNRVVAPILNKGMNGRVPIDSLCRHSWRFGSHGHAPDPAHRPRPRAQAGRGAGARRPSRHRPRRRRPGGSRTGRGLAFSQSLSPDSGVDVMIDFSLPPAVPGDPGLLPDAEDPAGRRHDRLQRRPSAARPG